MNLPKRIEEMVKNLNDSEDDLKTKQTYAAHVVTKLIQAVVEEVIGEDEKIETEYIRTNTGEVLGPMTDDIVTPQLNNLKRTQRQKLNSLLNKEQNDG